MTLCEDGVIEGHGEMAQQLSTEILSAALENLTEKRHQIDEQIAEVRRMLGSSRNGSPNTSESKPRKHMISAAGRRRIAAAQRRRWAEQKASSGTGPAPRSKKAKRRLSAEGRQAIVDALKKRWAARRAETAGTGKSASRSKPKTAAAGA
jgi:hypothetical protein